MLYGYGGQILAGAGLTLGVAALSLVCGLAIGAAGAAAKLSGSRFLRLAAEVYTTIVRGVPELLILLLLYYGGSVLLTWLRGDYVEVDALTAGVVALSCLSGAYATEVLRAAASAVPVGQIEAAKAFGMGRLLLLRRIMLPLLWRFALPGLGNIWLVLLKDTALISVVNLAELMRRSVVAAGATRKPFTFYAVAALIYLGFTLVSMLAVAWLERRANRGIRRA
ncbi:MAG TPA: ABC transporter permease subunit [Aliidongia sp.]|nr:ABC transporter permease subunit [Aliidongia sp.]